MTTSPANPSVAEVERFPHPVFATGYGWDDSRSSYRIQIGDDTRTVAYAWSPDDGRGDDATISDAWEIAKRMIEGWNARPPRQIAGAG